MRFAASASRLTPEKDDSISRLALCSSLAASLFTLIDCRLEPTPETTREKTSGSHHDCHGELQTCQFNHSSGIAYPRAVRYHMKLVVRLQNTLKLHFDTACRGLAFRVKYPVGKEVPVAVSINSTVPAFASRTFTVRSLASVGLPSGSIS